MMKVILLMVLYHTNTSTAITRLDNKVKFILQFYRTNSIEYNRIEHFFCFFEHLRDIY